MTITSTDNRVSLIREALLFEWITIAWMVIDAVTSLGILWFLVKEGREAWIGEQCCDDGH